MTTHRKLASIDLNLLTVFRAVDETRQVTRAAKALGLSQPALSHALRRLRDLFGDDLFVRTPSGMVPTPLAASLASPIRDALAGIEQRVLARADFDPGSLDRTFVVRTTDLLEPLVSPTLIVRLAREAPKTRFAMVPLGFSLPKEELETGACDLAVAGFFGPLSEGFRHEVLFEDTFACAVRAGHPRIRPQSKPSIDVFSAERHLLVAPGGELTGAVDRALAKKRKKRLVAGGATGFMVAAWMTSRSDCVLTAPSKVLAMLASELGLTRFLPPVPLDPIRVVSVWHARSDADPAHAWFRAAVAEAAK